MGDGGCAKLRLIVRLGLPRSDMELCCPRKRKQIGDIYLRIPRGMLLQKVVSIRI